MFGTGRAWSASSGVYLVSFVTYAIPLNGDQARIKPIPPFIYLYSHQKKKGDPRERSAGKRKENKQLTPTPTTDIGMLIALKSWPELGVHTRGAINNGVSEVEIREAILQAAIYCGVPAGIEATKVASATIDDMVAKGEHVRQLEVGLGL
jgi:hypothetical protein